ncbi:MAG: GDP-mannose 4,6-dehydratase [Phototrophicaceae bacterium]
MQVLVTGAGGFVGPYLIRHIQSVDTDATIFGSVYTTSNLDDLPPANYHQVDLLEYGAVVQLLRDTRPDVIYHLAGQSSPSKALKAVWRTIETNVRIQLNLFQACLELDIKPRILIMSSGEIYCGGASEPDIMPVNEQSELRPSNPYALSKVTQDLMGLEYYLSHKLPVIRVRPFNHTGAGQQPSFVAPDFALQIAKIEAGLQEPVMRVGNLDAERDFTDVRDVVRAYVLLASKGELGEAYNVSSNTAYSIQYLLDTLLSYTDVDIAVEIDEARFRPIDVPIVQGDNSRLQQLTGWQPTIGFEKTLYDLLVDCRERVQKTMRSNN